MKNQLAPMAYGTNILQSSHARLDHIPLVFAMMFYYYDRVLFTAENDKDAQQAVIDSLEKWWYDSDQDVMIASVILHPKFRPSPFLEQSRHFNRANLAGLMGQLYVRLFSMPQPPRDLYQQFNEFVTGGNLFQLVNGMYVNGVGSGKSVSK